MHSSGIGMVDLKCILLHQKTKIRFIGYKKRLSLNKMLKIYFINAYVIEDKLIKGRHMLRIWELIA